MYLQLMFLGAESSKTSKYFLDKNILFSAKTSQEAGSSDVFLKILKDKIGFNFCVYERKNNKITQIDYI